MSDSPHYLVATVYGPRVLGFFLAATLTALLHGEEILSSGFLCLLVLVCLAYPHIAHRILIGWNGSAQAVRWSMMVDAVLVGLLIVANNYYLFAAVAYLSFLILCTAVIAGINWLVGTVIVVSATILLGWFVHPFVFSAVSLHVDLGFAFALLVFPSFVAWRVFLATRRMEHSKRSAQSHQQSLQKMTALLSRYISPQVFQVLDALPAAGQTKRCRLTLCFTDLSGFTALMDQLPEHEMTEVLNEYLDAMATVAVSHGGTIDKFMGDGVMVFFGDPSSKGPRSDAVACANMALEMRCKLNALSATWNRRGLPNCLTMRIGIHTGYCAVGNFGSPDRMDYTAIGGAVNLASRLEACAPLGSILVSAATVSLLQDRFCFDQMETISLKGISQPVDCAVLLGSRHKPNVRFSLAAEEGVSIEVDLGVTDPQTARQALIKAVERLAQIQMASENEAEGDPVRLLR